MCVMERRKATNALNSRTVKGHWFLSLLRTILVNIAHVCVGTIVEPGALSFICGSYSGSDVGQEQITRTLE